MSSNHPQVSEQLESYESSGGDAPLTDTTATLPQATVLSPPAVSKQLESYESSGGDTPLTDTTATLPQATVLSLPVVSKKCAYSEEIVVLKTAC